MYLRLSCVSCHPGCPLPTCHNPPGTRRSAKEVSNEAKSELEADVMSDFRVQPLIFFTEPPFSDGVQTRFRVLSEVIKWFSSLVLVGISRMLQLKKEKHPV